MSNGRRCSLAAIVVLASGLAYASTLQDAAAVDQARGARTITVQLRSGPDAVRHLHIVGSDRDDSIGVEPLGGGESEVWIRASRRIILIDDFGACVQVGPSVVRCPQDLDGAHVETGAGNDFVAYMYGVDRYPVQIDVGSGNDTVYWFGTQPSGASLVRIWGREGDDEVQALRPDPLDIVWFRGGRGDDVTKGVTRAQGGRGDDTLAAQAYAPAPPTFLRGGPGRDHLTGERADDELRGGAGADQLKDHGGDDVVYGGGGSDVVAVDDGGHDDVNCGPGVDAVRRDWRDFVVGCETTSHGDAMPSRG